MSGSLEIIEIRYTLCVRSILDTLRSHGGVSESSSTVLMAVSFFSCPFWPCVFFIYFDSGTRSQGRHAAGGFCGSGEWFARPPPPHPRDISCGPVPHPQPQDALRIYRSRRPKQGDQQSCFTRRLWSEQRERERGASAPRRGACGPKTA